MNDEQSYENRLAQARSWYMTIHCINNQDFPRLSLAVNPKKWTIERLAREFNVDLEDLSASVVLERLAS